MSNVERYYIEIFVNSNFVFDTTSFDFLDFYTVEFQEEIEDSCAHLIVSLEITQ